MIARNRAPAAARAAAAALRVPKRVPTPPDLFWCIIFRPEQAYTREGARASTATGVQNVRKKLRVAAPRTRAFFLAVG